MLEKSIKKNLVEAKEKKEKLLIERRLVESRIETLLGDVKTIEDFNNLIEEKQLRLGFALCQEIVFLQENKFINEEDLSSLFKGLFGNLFSGAIMNTIYEKIIDKVLFGLGMGEGFFKDFLVSYLTSRPTELAKAISDCKLFTKLVVEGLTEAMVKWLQQNTGVTGGLADVLRNTIGATIRDSKSFKQNIEQEFAGTICSLFEKYTSNAKNVLANVTKTETPTPTTN
jgi:hypothetical protein